MSTAILRDERDLLWLVLDDVHRVGSDVLYDVHFLARNEPAEPPEPFLSTRGYREPAEGFDSLVENIGHAVGGEASALRHDPIADGMSVELKAQGSGQDLCFELVVWLDLTRMSRALKARGHRGRHQSGLRMVVSRADLESFRSELFLLANQQDAGIE